MSFNKI